MCPYTPSIHLRHNHHRKQIQSAASFAISIVLQGKKPKRCNQPCFSSVSSRSTPMSKLIRDKQRGAFHSEELEGSKHDSCLK